MIIRYGGGNDGIKDYLENGRKVDRHFSRDELDRRIPIEGDLNVTQAVIESIDDHGQERYLHITMSFHEPDITEEKMAEVFQQYKRELMTAYGDDEFNIYAEIHWPKIKEAYNHQTERMEPRFPHVHVVLPKRNLLTGGFLDPCSMQQRSVKYFDAIQEKLNRDNGLSSPRNSPRIGTNHYESALGKYKDKEFKTKNGELKRDIFNAMLARDVRTVPEFKALISEFGEVRTRNEGKDNEYFAIRVSGDKKFTNLKANIFDKQFIENRALTLEPVTDAQVSRRVDTWRNIQSKEIKFISNASAKVKETYKSLSLPERRQFLADRESYYEQRYREQSAGRKESRRPDKTKLPGLPEGNYKPSHLEFARGFQTEGASHLHELRASNVDHFRPEEDAANRLLLQGDADDDLQHLQPHGGTGLRRDLYAGGSQGGLIDSTDPQSSVLTSLIEAEREKERQKADLQRFAEIRKNLDPQHLLAFAQIRFGVDPEKHPVSKARDGSPRIKAGKLNLNVSDFLTKHIGLEWAEASQVLLELYEKQQRGIVDKPKSKVAHIDDWRRFRDEIYPKNIRTYEELKNQIKVSYSLGMKSINAEYFSRRKSITNDSTLSRTDKHYFRSVVILEKLQKVESLQHRVKEQNSLTDRVKYPYSTLFYDFATKNEEISMKVLEQLKRRYLHPAQESENTIGAPGLQTPHHMPSGAEAAKRARLIAKLHNQERELKELKIRVSDLRPKPLPSGAVAFTHKDHGKQIFVNHPDRLEMNRVTDHDEVAVGMIYAVERFGSPLDIKGTPEFKEQIIAVAAERDMDITFTDEALNQALQAKRLELGMEPLQANEIGVQELELDTSLPLDQAADKALLDSKVSELEQINLAYIDTPADSAELELREAMLAEALQRHEEVEAGFVDDARVEEIAKADVEAWAYLEGKPQQQHLALSMATALQNQAYSGYMEKNGPQELQLTIDATQVVQGREQERAAVQPEQAQAEAEATAPAMPEFTHNGQAATLDLSRFQQRPEAPTVERLQAEVEGYGRAEQEARERVAELERQREEEGMFLSEDDASALDERIVEARDQADGLAQAKARSEQELYAAAPELRPAAPQPAPLQFTHEGQPATLDLSRFQQQPEQHQGTPAEAERAAPEPLQFTHNGEPATLDLSRFQQQPEAPAPTVEGQQAEPAPLQFTHNGEPATLDLSRFQQQEVESRLVNPSLAVAPTSAGLQTNEQPPEVEAKVAELQRMQEQANDPDTYSEIFRYGEAVHRLESIEDGMNRDSAADRLARSHLMAFTDYEGTPYEQAMAEVIVDGMESNDRYRATIEEECPESMEVTLRAAQVGRDRAISLKDTAKDYDAQVMGAVNFGALSVDEMRVRADFDVQSLSGDQQRDGHVLSVMQDRMQYQPYREAVAESVQGLQQAQHPAADAIAERCDVLAKAADFEAINRQYQGLDAYDDPSSIARRGVMVEMEVRHSDLQIDQASPESIREVARQDLELFSYLDGKPEQQKVALAMGELMENEHYNAYMVNNAPQDFGITIEAAQVVSENQQSMTSVEHERDNNDMEI